MIDEMAKLILSYPGAVNRVRCLAHVVNLVVKIILRQFDSRRRAQTSDEASKGIKRSKKGQSNDEEGESTSEEGESDNEAAVDDPLDLGEIADDIEREEKEMDEGGGESDDEELGEDEVARFEKALGGKVADVAVNAKPARLVLTKVSVKLDI
jgi:hypothetical protein